MEHNYSLYWGRIRRVAALTAAALVLALAPQLPHASADVIFTFEGGGFGHSVGMSQYGAFGMARDGYTWEEIVTHYFTDTTVAAADPMFTEQPLWVGITQEQSRVVFTVKAIGPDPAPVVITAADASTISAAAGETIEITHLGSNQCRVTTPAGTLTGNCHFDLEWDGWEPSPTSALVLEGCTLPDWNAPGGTVFKPCTYARGTMHVRQDNNTATVDLTLEIDLEDYVLGISESPYGWGSMGGMAALEAQAVAARSYAIHRSTDRGDPTSRPWCWCQIYDTPVDQNYVGWGHGTQNWIDAVHNTEDMVATHPSETYAGVLFPIEAFYSSSTFGHTEPSDYGFTASVPYLQGVDDHWSLDPAVGNHSARWTVQFSGSTLASRLPGMNSVTGLEVTACSDSGAALEITFTGSGGPRTFGTRQLRGYLGLRSMQVIRAGSPLPPEPACPQPGGEEGGGEPPVEGGPVTLAGFTIDDDAIGDSFGNADGVAQCGEIIESFTTVTNEGAPLTGVGATLISTDPYVTVRWNTTSTFPNLSEGGSDDNDGDWDLTIAPDTPDQHQATLTMRVDAENGGPWDLDVTIPVSCHTVDAAAVIGVGDLDGNGAPDLAVAVRSPSGRQWLKTRDAATGQTTGAVRIASAAWSVIDLDRIPGTTGGVAALLRRDDGATRVVVADLATGTRGPGLRFGARHTPIAVTVVPAPEGGEMLFAVLMELNGGGSRMVARRSDGTMVSRQSVAIAPVDLETTDDLGSAPGADLAILGTGDDGAVTAILLDPVDRARLGSIPFGTDTAVDLESLRDAQGAAMLAVLQQRDGESVITLADPLTGMVLRTVVIPLAAALDLEPIPGISGEADTLAVLGLDGDGSPAAFTAEPDRGRVAAGPQLDGSTTPIDLAVLAGLGPNGSALAALTAAGRFEAGVLLWDPVSGEPLGTIRVP